MTNTPRSNPRLFVSHSNVDQAFAERLAADLRQAGAEAWIYEADDRPGNIMQRVNEMLARCDWLVLVLSPDSVKSAYVRTEVFVALDRMQKGYMRGVIPVVLRAVDLTELPTWEALRRFNATSDALYPEALAGVLRAVELAPPPTTHSTAIPAADGASGGHPETASPVSPTEEDVAVGSSDTLLRQWYQAGAAARAAGDLETAGAMWQRVLNADPDYDGGRLARQIRELATEYRPIGISELRASAQKAASGGDWTTAINKWNELLRLEPNDLAGRKGLLNAQRNRAEQAGISELRASAQKAASGGDWTTAINKWNELLRLEPNDLAGRKGLLNAQRNRAEQAHAANAWADEIAAWKALLQLEPESADARARIVAAEIRLQVEKEALVPPTPTPPAGTGSGQAEAKHAQADRVQAGDRAQTDRPTWLSGSPMRPRATTGPRSRGLLSTYTNTGRVEPTDPPPRITPRARDSIGRRTSSPTPPRGNDPMVPTPIRSQRPPSPRRGMDDAWGTRWGDDDWAADWGLERATAPARSRPGRLPAPGRRRPQPRGERASDRFMVWLALLTLQIGLGVTAGMLTRSWVFALIALGLGTMLAYLVVYRQRIALWSSLLAGALAVPIAWLAAAHAPALPLSGIYRAHVLFDGPGNTHPAVAQLWAVLVLGVALGVMPPLVTTLIVEIDDLTRRIGKTSRRNAYIALFGILPGVPYLAAGIALGLSVGGKRALLLGLALALGVYVVAWIVQTAALVGGSFAPNLDSSITVVLPILAASALFHYFLLSLFGPGWFGVASSLGVVVASAIILAGGIGLAVMVRMDM